MNRKTNRKSLNILAFIIISVFLLSSIVSYLTSRQSLKYEIWNSSLPLLSENIYSDLRSSLSVPINVSSSMARDTFLMKWVSSGEKDSGEIRNYLNNIKEKYGFFTTFFVSEESRNYYYYDGILKTLSIMDSHDSWYFDFKSSGREIDLDVDTDEASDGILTIFINYRLEDPEGNLLGVVGVGLKLDRIAESLINKQKKYNRNIYLVDENGYIQVHSRRELIEKVNIYNKEGMQEIAADLMAETEVPVGKTYGEGQQRIFVSSRYIPEMGWHVIVEQDEKGVYRKARRILYLNLLLTLAISGLLFAVSYRILRNFEKNMEDLAGTDTLTGTANRRELDKQFEIFQYRMQREKRDLSLILIDLDNFKTINDDLGHLTGDAVLKKTASVIQNSIRPTDLVVRWGGDEFIILMEGKAQDALEIAERLRRTCGDLKGPDIPAEAARILTISAGVAGYSEGEDLKSLIHKADKALYSAKMKGKNCVGI